MKISLRARLIMSLLLLLSLPGFAQHIDSINPQDPFQGGSIEILGSNFAAQQGPWRVRVYRTVRGRSQDFQCSVLSWSSTRILVEVPEDIPAGDYVLRVCDPERLTRVSNGVRLTVRERPPNVPPPSMAPWISRAHVTVQTELWIYGQHFGFQAGNRGIPDGARAGFYDNGNEVDLEIVNWRDDLVKSWLPGRCEPGMYEVAIVKGQAAWQRSNRMNVTVRPEMVGDAHPGRVPGFMHIDFVRTIPIKRGREFTVLGSHFDVYRQENRGPARIGQGRRVVQLVDVDRGQARAHDCAVYSTNPATDPDYLDQGNRQWFDDHIIVTAPSDLEPGMFLLRILDREDNRSSNTLTVRVVRNDGEAMHIERVSVSPIMAGGVREMTITGRNFGQSRSRSQIDISPGNPGFLVQGWTAERIRLQLAYTVEPGRYSVRLFADESRMDGSNQVVFDVAGHMHIDRVEFLDLRENNVKELIIHGRYFGQSRGQRVIDINPGTRIIVRQWADGQVRLRLSFNISPGRYSIRILEGGDNVGGSNTAYFEVPANRP